MTEISISESMATGFKDYASVSTSPPWAADSAFEAVDFTGQGNNSVVQAFSKNGNLSLRVYPSITHNSQLSLHSGDELDTEHRYANTIDWLSVPTQKTGAKVLVRVWEKDTGNGLFQLCATPYALKDAQQPSNGLIEMSTSALGTVAEHSKGTLSVVSCDINADGVYDIVTCKVETPGSDITFKFTTFLGDGLGGFQQLGDAVKHTYPYSPALSPGTWSATNLSGSQILELSYSYQEADSRDIVCFIAQGSSSGMLQAESMKFTNIAKSLPSGQLQYSPTDLNGTVVPSYNLDDITHAIATVTSPLGLRTAITYASLTDTTVYEPAVDWNETPTINPSTYDVVASPTSVVSAITNTNIESINAIPFQSSQVKVYKGAKTSRLGRGWQGFSNIITTNTFQDNDSFVVNEAFEQEFPLTGLKTQIQTSALGGPVMKSESLSYSKISQTINAWNIFRTDRTSEQTDTLDGTEVTRSLGTQYTKDKEGNVLERRDFEVQHGQLVNQSWNRYAYTTINGISGLQTCNKFTSNESNTDLTKYEEGDFSFTLCEFDPQRGLLLKVSEWSTDTDSFCTSQYVYDEYGNQISSVEASGLTVSTTYDSTFQTLPIQVTQTGTGFSHTRYIAYNVLTGLKVVSRYEKGLISCFSYDAFGRCVASKLRNTDSQASPQSATDFLGNGDLLMNTALLNELKDCMLDPSNSLQFQQISSSSGSKYLCTLSTMRYNGSSEGQTQVLEALNCLGLVCRQSTQQGQMTPSWKYWNYNHEGAPAIESFPIFLPSSVEATAELDYIPDPNTCVQTTFDALGRPTRTTRPSHSEADGYIAICFSYLDGGATVVQERFQVSSQTSDSGQTSLSTCTKKFQRLAGKDYITTKTDENGLTTIYTYDDAGRLLTCQDPAGNVETRTYNTRGQTLTMNNPSQNTQSDRDILAITRVYDVAGNLLSETNALGETQSFQVYANGRPLKKVGSDGRSIVYSYDQNGFRSLSSVTIFSSSSTETPESQFLFEYDNRGRVSKKTVILTNLDSYSTEFQYDWQNQIVNTQLPDGCQIPKAWQGCSLSSTAINGPLSRDWNISAEFSNYSSFERAGSCSISGTRFAQNFTHIYAWDTQGFPLTHTMSSAATLIQNTYNYNDGDQLQSIQELVSGQQTRYTYSGKRLASSTIGNQPANIYSYDDSGNMTTSGDITITYGASTASGRQNGTSVFQIDYDAAGRMIGRKTQDQALAFTYDGFGHMSTILETGSNEETRIINDFSGHTLQRLKSDGSQEIFINKNYTIIIKPKGQRFARYALFNHQELLASATVKIPAESLVSSSDATIQVHYCDTKSNVTHGYDPTNGTLVNLAQYDDYGLVSSPNTISSGTGSSVNTYESKSFIDFGLLDFGARWYDPLVGRFASPDDIIDLALLFCPDGTNRYAFENNDPINHVDPSGHFSWSAFWGGVVSGIMIVVGIGLMFASFGGSAEISSGLISGGLAGLLYSIKHANEKNSVRFWEHLGITVGVDFVIGAATEGLGAAMRVSKLGEWACDTAKSTKLATALRVGGKGLAGGVSSVADDVSDRELDNLAFDEHKDIWSGAGTDFAEGVGFGLLGSGKDELKDHFQAKYGHRLADSLKGELEWRRAGDGFLSKHGSEGFWKKVFSGIEKLRPPVPQWKIPTTESSRRVWTNPFTM
ncbi:virulence plasmid b [Fusarium coicis]|nr:virulence plasmid b [Fusarium coicis]